MISNILYRISALPDQTLMSGVFVHIEIFTCYDVCVAKRVRLNPKINWDQMYTHGIIYVFIIYSIHIIIMPYVFIVLLLNQQGLSIELYKRQRLK